MLALNKFRKEDETGFTLIELLVVILIIGILAAIAIPMFINQRKSAVDASVQSDVRNAASVVETSLIKNGGGVATSSDIQSAVATSKIGTGTTLASSGDSNGYCIAGTNTGGDSAANGNIVYASLDGGMKTLDDSHICQAGKIKVGTKPVAAAPLPAGAHSWSGSVQLVNRSLGVVADATLTAYTLSGESTVRINIVRADGTPIASDGDQFLSYLNFSCSNSAPDGAAAYGGVFGGFVDNKVSTTTQTSGGCAVKTIQLLDNSYDQPSQWGLVSQLDVPLS